MNHLDHIDRAIIQYLGKTRTMKNTNEVAEGLNISWATAKIHLQRLQRLKYVKARKTRYLRSQLWQINW